MSNSLVIRYAQWIIRMRWLVVALTLATLVLAGLGFKNFDFKSDYRIFFSEENPELVAFDEMQDTYSKADNVMFVIRPKQGSVFTNQTLASIEWLTEEAWQTPLSTRVDSITNFQYTYAEDDDLIVENLVLSPDDLTAEELQKIGDIATSEPLLLNRLISQDRQTTAVNVTVQMPDDPQTMKEKTAVMKVAGFARDLAQQLREKDPNLEVRITGMVMMNVSFPEATQNDLMSLLPLMGFVVVPIFMWFMVRTVSGVFASLLLNAFSIVAAWGIFFWLGGYLTGPAMSTPIVILTMGVADAVHILVTFLQQLRRGDSKEQAMVESLRINMQPVFLTSLTTVIGFLSMNASDVPPLHDFGNIIAIGVTLAFVFSVTFLPAIMMILPVKVSAKEPKAYHWMDNLGDWVINKRRILLPSVALLSVGAMAFIPNNQLNDEFVKYFSEEVPFRADTDFTSEHLTGIYNIFVAVKTGESNGVSDPAYLKTLERFVDTAKTWPEVRHVESITHIMKRLNKNMHGDDPSWNRLPEQKDLAAQYLLLYEMSLPQGLDLTNQINLDKSAARVGLTLYNLSSNELLDLEVRVREWFATNAPQYNIDAASSNLMFAHIGERNIKSSLGGTAIALILISGILMVALRSVKLGVLSLIPNLLPATIAFGLWGLLVANVGMGLSVVFGMTLGIVVDDTVHFLSKYLRARREKGLSPEDAVRYAFQTVGMALTVTTIVLVAGFYIMTLSTFTMNSEMGMMTAMTIAIALIVDFLLLPPLLIKLEEKQHAKETHNSRLADNTAA
ncbi:efflux RND transporter permease subunit [Pleionea litopenaei]|uniref:MMPL family transporter n=1 Tax=Pleionea litopenaei TaxID=3070815 RepID=A0AA51RQW0_9GAMM|nr:MMPL family transporter [Pleionea sp. HL-JVS1]WMS85977.1 MMPL family transporter [Pleionea sp. HL-JVS1]